MNTNTNWLQRVVATDISSGPLALRVPVGIILLRTARKSCSVHSAATAWKEPVSGWPLSALIPDT